MRLEKDMLGEKALPEELVGCDRQQVQEYCSKYRINFKLVFVGYKPR